MSRKALVIGIDDYEDSPLSGCVNDATEMKAVLERNGSGAPNFDVRALLSNNEDINTYDIRKNLGDLLHGSPDVALFYFAGHGSVVGDEMYLCSQDGNYDAPGFPVRELVRAVSTACEKDIHCIILLDCCFAGEAGNMDVLNRQIATLHKGVTIMTACRDNETAQEMNGHGVFTYLILDALRGGAADILGRITPAAVYSHIDQSLGNWDQRPLYKSHVDTFLSLRDMPAKVELDTLRKLPQLFPKPADVYELTPDHEHADQDGNPRTDGDPVLQREFRELQNCNRVGLVEPIQEKDMYWAAMKGTGCKLTALGMHYRRIAEKGRI